MGENKKQTGGNTGHIFMLNTGVIKIFDSKVD